MREILSPAVILALNTGELSDERATLRALGFEFKPVTGVYKTVTEDSYVVLLKQTDDLKKLMDLAAQHEQESILFLDERRNAKLVYLKDNSTEPLGRFTKVSEVEAKQHDNYTKDDNSYYVCKL